MFRRWRSAAATELPAGEFYQNTWSARYDLNWTVNSHDMKIGAEYLRWHDTGQWQLLSRGEFFFTANLPTSIAASPPTPGTTPRAGT